MFGHGFGCDQNTWRLVIPEFLDKYKIVLFDYVGAGNSDITAWNKDKYSDLKGYAQDIIDICDYFNLDNIIFVGHSVSSMIGLLAVKEHSDLFQKIVFIGPSPRYINDQGYLGGIEADDLDELLELLDSNYIGWSSIIAPQVMGNPDRPELGNALVQSFCATDPEIARSFARVTFLSDNREDLKALNIPSLTIQCNDDFLTSKWVAEYINQHTRKNTIVMLESSGHCPHLSDPKGVTQALKEFIDFK